MAKAKIFVISAPSGCGKTTLCRKLLGDRLGLVGSVSMTTRRPRPDETGGADYHFVSEKHFRRMAEAGQFLEHEENFGNLYGTPKKFISDNLKKGKNVLLSIDVKGATKVRRVYGPRSVLIFILPPSISVLKKRLVARMSDNSETIATRLANARRELSYKGRYDYRIINDRLDRAYKRLKAIVRSEINR